jgi:hypothetical protein
MLTLANLFYELANVQSESPNGITAPFSPTSIKTNKLLSDLQTLNLKTPDEQAKIMKRIT